MDGTVAHPRPLFALGLRLAAALALATMAMLVKLAGSRGVHVFEMIFWRQAITLPLILAGAALTGSLVRLRTKRIGAHLRRSALGLTAMCFVYGALTLLPLAEATTLSFTTPLFAVMLAVLLFRERVGPIRWSAVALGFAGVAIVMRPDADIAEISLSGVAVGLVAALMVAAVSFQIQDLNRTESPQAIVAWFTALTIPITALALPFVASSHDYSTWLVVLGVALSGALGQILLTSSLRHGHAASVMIMDYSSLLWATIYGWAVFERPPTSALALGAPLVVFAGLLIAWREHRLGRLGPVGEPNEI